MNKKLKNKKYRNFAIWLILVGFIVTISFSFIIIKQEYFIGTSIDINKLSSFGAFIGGVVGSIWSLAGVLLIFQALNDQQILINLNFKEHLNHIEELNLSKESLKQQNEILTLQKFESTFFILIDKLISIEEKVKVINKSTYFYGKNAFKIIKNNFENEIYSLFIELVNEENEEREGVRNGVLSEKNRIQKYLEYYKSLNSGILTVLFNTHLQKKRYSKTENHLFVFFRLITRVLNHIEKANFPKNIKNDYLFTLTSILSKEQIIIAYSYDWFSENTNFNNSINDLYIIAKKNHFYDEISLNDLPIFILYKKLGSITIIPDINIYVDMLIETVKELFNNNYNKAKIRMLNIFENGIDDKIKIRMVLLENSLKVSIKILDLENSEFEHLLIDMLTIDTITIEMEKRYFSTNLFCPDYYSSITNEKRIKRQNKYSIFKYQFFIPKVPNIK